MFHDVRQDPVEATTEPVPGPAAEVVPEAAPAPVPKKKAPAKKLAGKKPAAKKPAAKKPVVKRQSRRA
jgi:hypothetical protein